VGCPRLHGTLWHMRIKSPSRLPSLALALAVRVHFSNRSVHSTHMNLNMLESMSCASDKHESPRVSAGSNCLSNIYTTQLCTFRKIPLATINSHTVGLPVEKYFKDLRALLGISDWKPPSPSKSRSKRAGFPSVFDVFISYLVLGFAPLLLSLDRILVRTTMR